VRSRRPAGPRASPGVPLALLGAWIHTIAIAAGCAPAPPTTARTQVAPARPEPAARIGPDDPNALADVLEQGAERIELLPGVHRPERAIHLNRPVELFGSPAGGGARLYARVVVTGRGVDVHDLQLRSGVAARFARDLRIATATITAGGERDALTLVDTTAELEAVALDAGPDHAAFATSSTLSWIGGRANGGLRSVRLDGGRLSARDVAWRGASLAGLWADRKARVRLEAVEVATPNPDAVALHVTGGATLTARRLAIATGGFAVLARRARARIEDAEIRHRGPNPALGAAGATVSVARARLTAGPGGVGSVGSYDGWGSHMALADVEIAMPAGKTAVTVERGTLRVERVVAGGGGAGVVGPGAADAWVIARGRRTRVDVDGLWLRRWPALAGFFSGDARVRIRTATVARAAGGFAVESVRHPTARLSNVRVEGCISDPAFGFVNASARVATATVSDCPPGGIVAGQGARVHVRDVHVRGGRFGFGAFDGAELIVSGGRVRDAALAAVAGCVGRPRLVLNETETSTLAVARCR